MNREQRHGDRKQAMPAIAPAPPRIRGRAGVATTDEPSLADLRAIYARRFAEDTTMRRRGIWIELARFLQRYIPADARILDLACDHGDFINHIRAADRWAVDIRDVRSNLEVGVEFRQSDGLALLEVLPSASFDVVFISNYLEHLANADAVVAQLRVVRELLRPGGRALILQPNIRLIGGAYWDFLDHKTPLTDKSLEEAGQTAGLDTFEMITRFIPYTTKSRMPQHRWLVRAYLAFRPAWRLFGKQTLYVAERPLDS